MYFLFMYACTFRTIGRIARAGPQIFAAARFSSSRNHHLFFNRCPDDRHIDARLFSPSVSRHRTEPNRTMRNPLPFIAASASNGDSPTSRRASSRHRRRPGSRTRTPCSSTGARSRGVEPAPRPGAEAAVNKRRCAHLQSHIGDVLSGEGSTSRRTGAEDGRSRGRAEVGENWRMRTCWN